MVAQIPDDMIMGGRTCHHCWMKTRKSLVCLSSFLVVASQMNLSLQYVNSSNWTFKLGLGEIGVWL